MASHDNSVVTPVGPSLCLFVPTDTTGEYVCGGCDRSTTPGRFYDAPPVRQCMGDPIARAVSAMTARYAQIRDPSDCLPLADLLARVDRCFASTCKHITTGVCLKSRTKECKRIEVWFTRLMLAECSRATPARPEIPLVATR